MLDKVEEITWKLMRWEIEDISNLDVDKDTKWNLIRGAIETHINLSLSRQNTYDVFKKLEKILDERNG